MRRNAEYPRRVPKCQKPRNEKKTKTKQKQANCSAFYLHFNFALDDDRRRTLWRLQSQLHSPNCTAVQSQSPGVSESCSPRTARPSPSSSSLTPGLPDSLPLGRQVLLTAILCCKMSFGAYQRLTSDRSQPKNNGHKRQAAGKMHV